MPELTEAGARLLTDVRDAAQLALRRIVVDAARASKLPSLTTEQRTEWRERAEVWADTAAGEFAGDQASPPRRRPRRHGMDARRRSTLLYLARLPGEFPPGAITARNHPTT